MLIDWFTVAAQLVNFLILLALLRHFLYRPLLRAVAERERHLKSIQDAADTARQQAEAEAARLAAEREAVAKQRQQVLDLAMADAQAERRHLLDGARREAEQMQQQWQQALASEFGQIRHDIVVRTLQEVYAVSGRLMSELAGTELESRMAVALVARISDHADVFADVARSTEWLVRSAFELSPASQQLVQRAIHAISPDAQNIRYEQEPGLLCGLELRAGGHRLAWNAADYLQDLQERLATMATTAARTGTE